MRILIVSFVFAAIVATARDLCQQYAIMDSLPAASTISGRDHLTLQPLQKLRSPRGSSSSSNLRTSRSPSASRSSEQSKY